MKNNQTTYFMELALKAAKKAFKIDEVPIGAVIVKDGQVIAKGFNRCIKNNDATAHAEIIAIRNACKKLKNYRLNDCDLYVTIEPCAMCMGAIVNARIRKVYFGAYDKKAGACKSVFKIARNKKLNHKVDFEGAKKHLLNENCVAIIKDFFKQKRKVL